MSTPREWKILAPGKLILMGEYAVLEGAPAVAIAVNRYVVVERGGSTASGLVALAREQAARRIGFAPPEQDFIADSSALRYGSQKLGLGSSGAVAAGAVASVFHQAGNDIEDSEARKRMWDIAHEVHDSFQGTQGSGIDIAASLFGGRLVMRREPFSARPVFSRWTPPRGVRWVYVWTGREASTPHLLAAVRQYKAAEPLAYAKVVSDMKDIVERFLDDGSVRRTVMLECLHRYASLMERLGQSAGVPIVDARTSWVLSRARASGGAAKPSGAGGGDFVVAAFPADRNLGPFHQEIREGGMQIVDLDVAARGVHVRQKPPSIFGLGRRPHAG